MNYLRALLVALALAVGGVVCLLPNVPVGAANTVQNQPVLVAATAIPTGGFTSNLASLAGVGAPSVGVFTAYFTNSGASAVYCGLYGTSPTLGTTPTVGAPVAVPASGTQPIYFGPSNGVAKQPFANGIFAACTTTFGGSTGVAQTTVAVGITFL